MQKRPIAVWLGSCFLSAELALLVVTAVYHYELIPMFTRTLTIILTSAVVILVWARQGWARYAVALLLAYKLWNMSEFMKAGSLASAPLLLFMGSLDVLLMTAGLGILFSKESRAWFSRAAALRSEALAGRMRSYWLAFAFAVLILGWVAYPLNLLALMMAGSILGFGAEGQGDKILVSGMLYSMVLFGLGSVLGFIFDAASKLIAHKNRLAH